MEEFVRRSQLPQRSAGFKAASPLGSNLDPPVTSFGNQGAGAPVVPYARADQPQDWSRWPQLRALLAGGHEVSSDWLNVSGSYVIDPNYSAIWLLRCQSESLSLTFAALEGLPEAANGSIWATAIRSVTVTIIIEWLAAASGDRTLSLPGVNFPDSTAPEWTSDPGVDELSVIVWSNGFMVGRDVALNLGEPS